MLPGLMADINLSIFAAIMCSVIACFSAISHVADLMVHFRVQMAAALVFMVLVLVVSYKAKPSPKLLVVAILALILNAVCIGANTLSFDGSGPLPQGAVEKGARALTVLQYNIHSSNKNHQALIDYVGKYRPDVLCLEEYNSDWHEGLLPLRKDYPYQIVRARNDNFGIAIFSRLPIQNAAILPLGKAAVPSAYCQLERDGRRWSILATHPLPPTTGASYDLRNDQFQALATFIKADKGDLFVLAGDLNCTPWSAHFINFLSASGLKDTRLGFGIGESWPVNCAVLRIPIDHVLVSKNLKTKVRRVEPDLGSDHLPVYVELTAGGFTKSD